MAVVARGNGATPPQKGGYCDGGGVACQFGRVEDFCGADAASGAGGAQMWMEEQNNDRVNTKRTKQLIDTGATTITTACPFCVTMITDGVKAEEKIDMVKVKDIAELVAENLV